MHRLHAATGHAVAQKEAGICTSQADIASAALGQPRRGEQLVLAKDLYSEKVPLRMGQRTGE